MLDVHRLRVFRAVVASGSVRAAAENLGYTPSAVSQHLTSLQRETGLTLFAKVGRGIEPTDAGRELAASLDGVLDGLGRLEGLVADLRDGRSRSLTLGYFGSAGTAWMPQVVARVSTAFPDVRIDLVWSEHFAPKAARRIDVQALVAPRSFAPPPGFRAVEIARDPFVAVVPAADDLAGRSGVTLAELAQRPWVDNDVEEGTCRHLVVEACASAGVVPPFRHVTHDYATAAAFVAAGLGVTIIAGLAVGTLPEGVVAVPIVDPTPVRHVHAVVRTATEAVPAVGAALDALVDIAAGDGAYG